MTVAVALTLAGAAAGADRLGTTAVRTPRGGHGTACVIKLQTVEDFVTTL